MNNIYLANLVAKYTETKNKLPFLVKDDINDPDDELSFEVQEDFIEEYYKWSDVPFHEALSEFVNESLKSVLEDDDFLERLKNGTN